MKSYVCKCCNKEIRISDTYSYCIEQRNPERVCRKCRHRDGLYDYDTKYQVTDEGRKCLKCEEWKPWSRFPSNAKFSGKNPTCLDCCNSRFTTRYNTDMEFRDKIMQANKKSHLKRKYGLTIEQYESLLDKYEYKCAICGSEERPCIDHNHDTNFVRGILCRNCNKGLGIFKDSIELITKALEYLHAFKDKE